MCQWLEPSKGDWTEQVKKDLVDFKISSDLHWIKSQNKSWFKNYVNKCEKKFTFEMLLKKQQTHSKLKNVKYINFKMQSYLKSSEINTDTKRKIMGYRLRMLEFGENFRGVRDNVPCPLGCTQSRDYQTHLYECLSIDIQDKKQVRNEDFLNEDIEIDKILFLEQMLLRRQRKLEEIFPAYTPY